TDGRQDLYFFAVRWRATPLIYVLVQLPLRSRRHDESSRSYAPVPGRAVSPTPETESLLVPSRSSVQPTVQRPGAQRAESPPALRYDSRASAVRLNTLPVAHCHPVLSEEPTQVPAPAWQHSRSLPVATSAVWSVPAP